MQSNLSPSDPIHTPAPLTSAAPGLAEGGREVVPAAQPTRESMVFEDLGVPPAAPPKRISGRPRPVYRARTPEAAQFLRDAFRVNGVVTQREVELARAFDACVARCRVGLWKLHRARRDWGSAP